MMPRESSLPRGVIEQETRINTFRDFIRQTTMSSMPARYISRVKLIYEDGTEEDMGFDYESVTDPSLKLDGLVRERARGPIKDSRVIIDLSALERDVNRDVNKILGHLG